MARRSPNVILIYADDLGRGMLSLYGQRHFQTPNIDRIGTEGMRSEQVYGCSLCAPARASLITGIHDCHRGGYTFTSGQVYDRFTEGRMSLSEIDELLQSVSHRPSRDDRFLGELFQEAGYVTGQIGKLEWGFATSDSDIRRHGWDYHYGYYDHVHCHGFYPPYLFENGEVVPIEGNTRMDCGKAPESESPENFEKRWDPEGCAVYSQDLFDEKTIEFLDRHADQPFFLFLPTQLPHGPIRVPEVHPSVKDHPELTQFEKEWASMVLRIDQTVGLILDELQKRGLEEDTLVLFTSDNGHSPYYKQPLTGRMDPNRNLQTGESYDNIRTKFYSELSGDVFDGNDGMAGLKFSNWEGGIRLPFMARWPGTIPAGSSSRRMISNYDFMPTIAELLGQEMPPGKDGVSYADTLRDPSRPGPSDRHIVVGSGLGPTIVHADGWKLKMIREPKNFHFQLYHLPSDPKEENDLCHEAEHREVVVRLSTQLMRECDGNTLCGTPEAHRAWLPGLFYSNPECSWEMSD